MNEETNNTPTKKPRAKMKILVLERVSVEGAEAPQFEQIGTATNPTAAAKLADENGEGTYVLAVVRQTRQVTVSTNPVTKVKILKDI